MTAPAPETIARYRKLRALAADPAATGPERETAGRLAARLERAHPGLAQAAAQAAGTAGAGPGRPAGAGAPQGAAGPVPGPFDAGAYGAMGPRPRVRPAAEPPPPPAAAPGSPWGVFAERAKAFVAEALNDLGLGYTLSDLANERTSVEIHANTRTVHVHVRIPVEVLEQIADFGDGSASTYAKLIGARVGASLADVLRRHGLT